MKKNISLILILFVVFSCGHKSHNDAHDHSQEASDHESHAHASELPEIDAAHKMTLFSSDLELFVKMPEPVAGKKIDFLAYLTKLENYKPLHHAKLNLNAYLNNKKIVSSLVFKEVNHGVYHGEITLPKDGDYDFEFVVVLENKPLSFWKRAVHACDHQHGHEHAEEHGVNFTKEQAWEVDFSVAEVLLKDFNYTVKASGKLLPARGNFQSITAKSNGIINFVKARLDNGSFVKKGENVFTISGEGLSENNIENHFTAVSSQYQKSKSDYERKQKLFKERIVSARAFEESKAQFQMDSSQYFILLKKYQKNGIRISAPISGNIYELNVSDGDYVEEGQTLANILNDEKMRLHVDVPQRHYALLDNIQSVNFKVAYNDEVYTLEGLNGKLISRASVANRQSGFVPVIFEIENKNLLAGSFAECWLLTKSVPNCIVIPKSALIEEQGNFFVYVQTDGETYEKRYVSFNIADGLEVWVTEGLKSGERVVTKGNMFVKVASAAGQMPVHSHEH